ncbi:MAG: tyrosine-type recombinase/integrase [Bacteroidota bacterium]
MNASAFLEFLEYEKRLSSHTLTAYRSDLNQFFTFLQATYALPSIAEVSHLHVRSWMVHLTQQNIRARSINRKLSCLKSFFRFERQRGSIQHNPLQKIVAPKTGKRLPTFVHRDRIDQLFRDVDFGEGYSGQRNRTLLELLYGTGMRRSELIGLRVGDVDLCSRNLRVLGKGNKERLIPLHPHLAQVLTEYLEVRTHHFGEQKMAPLLLTDKGRSLYPKLVYNIVKRYLSTVTTVEQRSPHVLRHTFATHLSDNGADLNAIKELLGHASLAATQVYTHNSIERLREVYQRAHPKGEGSTKEAK